jgi:uncharacterized protein
MKENKRTASPVSKWDGKNAEKEAKEAERARVKTPREKSSIYSRIFLGVCAVFALFSLINGAIGIAGSLRVKRLSECLDARAKLNYITGEKLSLYPGGPVAGLLTENTPENGAKLKKILERCEAAGFAREEVFSSFIFDTNRGKGDRVVDTTNTLSGADIRALKEKLNALEKERGSQVVVVMTHSVRPFTIEQYAEQLFGKWKIGREKIDDGVLFLVAKDDRQMRIEVGYGLEGILPDGAAKDILRDTVKPFFAAGRYDEGVKAGVDRIIAGIKKEKLPAPEVKKSFRRFLEPKTFGIFFLVFSYMYIFVPFVLSTKRGILAVMALLVLGQFNYLFNHSIFLTLAAVETLLIVLATLVYWDKDWWYARKRKKECPPWERGEGGDLYGSSSFRTYDSSLDSTYSDSDSGSSDSSDFSGGGGESGGGGASEDW